MEFEKEGRFDAKELYNHSIHTKRINHYYMLVDMRSIVRLGCVLELILMLLSVNLWKFEYSTTTFLPGRSGMQPFPWHLLRLLNEVPKTPRVCSCP